MAHAAQAALRASGDLVPGGRQTDALADRAGRTEPEQEAGNAEQPDSFRPRKHLILSFSGYCGERSYGSGQTETVVASIGPHWHDDVQERTVDLQNPRA